MGHSPWGPKESDTTEQLTLTRAHTHTHRVLLTKDIFCSKFTKFYAGVHYLFYESCSRFQTVFSCIEQLQLHATNSGKFSFHFYKYFLIFLVMVSKTHLKADI